MAARRLPADWQQRYGYRPVLQGGFALAKKYNNNNNNNKKYPPLDFFLHVGRLKAA